MNKKITVFAGNICTKGKENYYFNLAYHTGKLLAQAGYVVVNGGGPGLMDALSKGAMEAGGETIGICLDDSGGVYTKYLTYKEMYNHLNSRQARLLELGDGYIALPGGIGTFYEIFAVLALKRKDMLSKEKPFIILDKYFVELNISLEKMISEGFIGREIYKLFMMIKTPEEAVKVLKGL